MDIKTIRRTQLQKWVKTHGTPQAEKSLFSQLSNPEMSFGEKLARRLERDYEMGNGYLDSTADIVIGEKEGGDDIEIPQYDAGGSMGGGKLVIKEQPGLIKNWHVDHEWIRQNVKHKYTSISNLCIVTGFGDSMRGMFNPGDPLLVDCGVTDVEFDGVYFFRVSDEGFIKRLQRIPGEGLIVISENKAYRDWTVKPGMDFQCFGKVLTVWKSEQF